MQRAGPLRMAAHLCGVELVVMSPHADSPLTSVPAARRPATRACRPAFMLCGSRTAEARTGGRDNHGAGGAGPVLTVPQKMGTEAYHFPTTLPAPGARQAAMGTGRPRSPTPLVTRRARRRNKRAPIAKPDPKPGTRAHAQTPPVAATVSTARPVHDDTGPLPPVHGGHPGYLGGSGSRMLAPTFNTAEIVAKSGAAAAKGTSAGFTPPHPADPSVAAGGGPSTTATTTVTTTTEAALGPPAPQRDGVDGRMADLCMHAGDAGDGAGAGAGAHDPPPDGPGPRTPPREPCREHRLDPRHDTSAAERAMTLRTRRRHHHNTADHAELERKKHYGPFAVLEHGERDQPPPARAAELDCCAQSPAAAAAATSEEADEASKQERQERKKEKRARVTSAASKSVFGMASVVS